MIVTATLSLALLAACEKESDPTGPGGGPPGELNEIVTLGPIDASSSTDLTYISLAEGKVVPASGEWEIALRRYEVRLNGGVSGTGDVTGYSVGNNASATDEQVLAFTVENTHDDFDAIREAQIPADAAFESDRLFENAYGYLNLGGVPTANPAAYWKVRLASGDFAAVRVTEAVLAPPTYALTPVTIEARLQEGSTLGAPTAFTVPVGDDPVAISVASGAAVTPDACNWDLQVDPGSFELSVNAGCNAGTYPGGSAPTFVDVTSASDAAEYAPWLAGLTGPIPNSVTEADAPFRYNLEGTNRLDPVFNTYLVKSGSTVYKIQLTSYYGTTGASGWPTIRYARIK